MQTDQFYLRTLNTLCGRHAWTGKWETLSREDRGKEDEFGKRDGGVADGSFCLGGGMGAAGGVAGGAESIRCAQLRRTWGGGVGGVWQEVDMETAAVGFRKREQIIIVG